jgi:polyisoprenyl-phosphate glycosyltransferase
MEKEFEVSLLIPLYNEQETFPKLIERIKNVLHTFDVATEVVLINDGSQDNTPLLMEQIALEDDRFQCVFLSRNYGHQFALTAGMQHCRATKAIMVLDGDLQDPPELITEFYKLINEGNDVVYAIRKKRKEGIIKRILYWTYYRIMNNISSINIPLDSGDFCMMSRRVLNQINAMPERNRYIRGMRSWVGYKQVGYEYERSEREAGESKYSFNMLWRLAYSGIFNFSEFPIKFITRLGFVTILFSLIYFADTLYKKIFHPEIMPQGFTMIIFLITLFCGVQLLSLGLIGEYVLRIYEQVKGRPIFVTDKIIRDKKIST